ncbi:MAG: PKD domain-containing protein [Candidatus Saelkia tenebricola]|nr:PKD domain-containing protein [Candidatus Saelkia tenebricola]
MDISAPAENIYSTIATDLNEDYGLLSGTSMSTAFVTGLAGLLLSQNEDLTKGELIALLKENVDEVTLEGDEEMGEGRINASKALEALNAGTGGIEAIASVNEEGEKSYAAQVGEEVSFLGEALIALAQSSLSPEEEDLEYQWDFGDGIGANEQNTTHVYQEVDDYNVILVVSAGGFAPAIDTVSVMVVDEVPDDEIWVVGTVIGEDGELREDVDIEIRYSKRTSEDPLEYEDSVIEACSTDVDGRYKVVIVEVEEGDVYKIEGRLNEDRDDFIRTASTFGSSWYEDGWVLIAEEAQAGNVYDGSFDNSSDDGGGGGGGDDGGGGGDDGGGGEECTFDSQCPSVTQNGDTYEGRCILHKCSYKSNWAAYCEENCDETWDMSGDCVDGKQRQGRACPSGCREESYRVVDCGGGGGECTHGDIEIDGTVGQTGCLVKTCGSDNTWGSPTSCASTTDTAECHYGESEQWHTGSGDCKIKRCKSDNTWGADEDCSNDDPPLPPPPCQYTEEWQCDSHCANDGYAASWGCNECVCNGIPADECEVSEYECNNGDCVDHPTKCEENAPPPADECEVSEYECNNGDCVDHPTKCEENAPPPADECDPGDCDNSCGMNGGYCNSNDDCYCFTP